MSSLRDRLRAKVFSGEHKPITEIVDFFGADIELRQPVLAQVIAAQKSGDRESAIIDMLVSNAYVPTQPGQPLSTELVFEDTDADGLKALPFDHNFLRVSAFFEKVTDISFREGQGTAEEAAGAETGSETGVGTEAS